MPNKTPVSTQPSRTAIVIGGGIVGICCALYLQRDGYDVTLVDNAEPGDSTAKFSCGLFAVSEVIPLSKLSALKKAPRWLLDPSGPLTLRPSAIPRLLPWFLRFLACARSSKIREIAEALSHLTVRAYDDYRPLIAQTGHDHLVQDYPIVEVFDQASEIEAEARYIDLRRELGFAVERLGADDLHALEPALAEDFRHGLLLKDWRAVADTRGFIRAMTDSFLQQGGTRLKDEVVRLNDDGSRATGVELTGGRRIEADVIVVAAGAGSKRFFDQIGVRAPLEGVAGYQVLLSEPGIEIRHPVIYWSGGFGFTPMERGLAVGGLIEFSGNGAPPNLDRPRIMLQKAKRVFPALNVERGETGVGYRPFLPDTKPVIDRSSRLSNVFMAFGHGQLGLTLGATTARLVADLVAGRNPGVDMAPFRANRY